MKNTVLLLHGIWMRPLVMSMLANRFTREGYEVLNYTYSSLQRSPIANAELLYQKLQHNHQHSSQLHIVAHSLGGIVALHLLAAFELPPGHFLTLGSPVRGSDLATRISSWPLSHFLLGRSMECGLSGEAIPQNCPRNWGMIAGSQARGIALLIGGFSGRANDGTVLLEETHHPAINHHLTLPVSHTGMLFSQSVANEACHFLKYGKFSSGST